MKINSKILVASSLFVTVLFTACNKDDDNNTNIDTPNATDANFMTQAAYGNNNEVNFGQLALTKSGNYSVKMFAQMMIDDHTMAQSGLDSLATQYNFSNLPDSIDSTHQMLRTQLAALDGYSFDTAYINGQVRDHQQTIALFQTESSAGNAINIKAFAQRLLPNLQMHLQHADSLASHF